MVAPPCSCVPGGTEEAGTTLPSASVTVDGRLVCSCLVLGVEAEGRTVNTIEGLSDGDRALTGVNMVPSVAEAVQASVDRSGERRVAVVPEGPYVVPRYQPTA